MGDTRDHRAWGPSGDQVGISAVVWEVIQAGTTPHRWKGQSRGGQHAMTQKEGVWDFFPLRQRSDME